MNKPNPTDYQWLSELIDDLIREERSVADTEQSIIKVIEGVVTRDNVVLTPDRNEILTRLKKGA